MKKLLVVLALLSNLCLVYSQDFDLIVKSNGDSIACHIDSITDTQIYFEMKSNDHWIHTQISMTDVAEYKRNVINKKVAVFKPGTSYIISPLHESDSMQDIHRNSVYIGILTINYSRIIPGKHVSYTLAGGLSFVDALGILAETTILIGGKKHFFEPGIMVDFSSEFGGVGMIRTGYRYQGPRGFLFRAALMLAYIPGEQELFPLPGASIGYSF